MKIEQQYNTTKYFVSFRYMYKPVLLGFYSCHEFCSKIATFQIVQKKDLTLT